MTTPVPMPEWPQSVKNGVFAVIGGWLGVYAFMFVFSTQYGRVFSNRLILQTVILGVGLSFFIIRGKNWARIISIYGNFIPLLLALFYLLYVHVFHAIQLNWLLSALALVTAIAFGLSIFFLIRPTSRAHFQLSSQDANDIQNGDATNG